jgi:Subtilase family
MKSPQKKITVFVFFAAVFSCFVVQSQSLDQIGVTLLRAVTTNVDGTGIRVAQPEAGYDQVTNWEVNPGVVGQPLGLITYISANGSTTNFPNSLSSESSHADSVAGNFYGISGGVATNVAHVDNYDANDLIQVSGFVTPFSTNYTASLPAANINDPVVNQSFSFGSVPTDEQQAIDTAYDNYAAQYNTLFVSAANNGGPVSPPGTAYNCISVGAYIYPNNYSSIGPTLDNGRAKPDITAPSTVTSFSTPQVAGAAAVLMQAGLRGDGGGDTNSPADIRTVKALLLNGAVKPADWTNNSPSPLDVRYGAGMLNVFNSYEQLVGGKHSYIISNSVAAGSAHPPTGATGTIGALSGWDFNTNSSSFATDGVNHYFFNVSNNFDGAIFTVTATLVWNRHQNKTAINNLDLFLYDAVSSNLIACSTSLVDNVEHIWLPQLPPGRYDLQVLKNGGTAVSASETYALAWEFFSLPLSVAPAGASVALTWPIYPTGFTVEATTNLIPPVVWSVNSIPPPVLTNNQNYILLNAANAAQFFRLRRP